MFEVLTLIFREHKVIVDCRRGGNKPDIGSAVNGGDEMDEQREEMIFVRSNER